LSVFVEIGERRYAVRRIRDKLTYANSISSLALFVALGGTSYALTLPRDSVGSAQIRPKAVGSSEIRTGAVRSSDVRNRALGIQDLSLVARTSLRGQTGPVGPPGPPGPTYTAAVTALGQKVRGNSTGAISRGLNESIVGFDRNVDDCVSTATLATVDGPNPPAGRVTVSREAGRVVVRTYNTAGDPQRLGFHLIVAC
jgi:hypothetical protein